MADHPVTVPIDVAPERLRARLAGIAGCLAREAGALALLGLGSCGVDEQRLDRWSDLDVFAICDGSVRQELIDNPRWLSGAGTLVWMLRNTADGWKALYDDGVLVECAVFEPSHLAWIPHAGRRVIWHDPGFDPASLPGPPPLEAHGRAWLAGEVASALLVGLKRLRRGEILAARQSILVAAVENLLRLEAQGVAAADPFNPVRRAEGWTERSWVQDLAPQDLELCAKLVAERLRSQAIEGMSVVIEAVLAATATDRVGLRLP
jgi:lincosamide nucleotidyltransferase B/F